MPLKSSIGVGFDGPKGPCRSFDELPRGFPTAKESPLIQWKLLRQGVDLGFDGLHLGVECGQFGLVLFVLVG